MDKDFVLERKDMLNNFIRHLAKYNFFVESLEFGMFASYTGDLLEKQAKALPKETPLQKLAKYQKVCQIDMSTISPEKRHDCKMTIQKFNLFINTCLNNSKAQRKTHEELAERREV